MTVADEAPPPAAGLPTPGLSRRMAAFVYEGVLLFGVVFVAGFLYSTLTRQDHALRGQTGLQAFVFIVLALYFVTFWSRGGQTVAMQAWHVRLVTTTGTAVSPMRALARYLLSWLWFAPALIAAHSTGLHSAAQIFGLMIVGVVAYALLTFLHPHRQFLHDAVCGTQLVTWRAKSRR
jgi:uncharacterized RDD family membrane protein YckC